MGTELITFDGTNAPTSAMGPADGDSPIAGADVVPGIQAAGDTAWNALLRVRPLAGLADLRAITAPADGLTRYVLGYGIYTFKASSGVATNVEPWCVAATDATPGFWVHSSVFERRPSYRAIPLLDPFGVSTLTSWASWGVVSESLTDPVTLDVVRTSTGVSFGTVSTTPNLAKRMYFRLDTRLVHGTRLTNAQLTVAPVAHASLPGTPPRFTIARFGLDPWSTTLQNLISAGYYSDGASPVASYNAAHEFGGVVDQNHDIDLYKYSYVLIVANEGGGNAASGLALGALELVMS